MPSYLYGGCSLDRPNTTPAIRKPDALGGIRRFASSEKNRVVASFLLVILVAIPIYLFIPVTYQVGDDAYYRAVTAGYVTGVPDGHTVFTGYLLASLIASLERVFPTGVWYDVFTLVILLLSSISITKSLMKKFYRSSVPTDEAMVLLVLFVLAFFAFPLSIANYSTTSILAGAASVSLLFEYGEEVDGERQALVSDGVLIPTLLFLCLEWRLLMFEVSCCFFAVVLFHRFIRADAALRKDIILVVISCVLLSAAGLVGNFIVYSPAEWDEYIQFNRARAHFMDYRHPSFSANQEMYESFGWTEELLDLVENKFLMSESINREAFVALSGSSNGVAGTLRYLIRFFRTRPLAQGFFVGWVFLTTVQMRNEIRSKRNPIFSPVLHVSALYLLVLLYCCHQGNLFFRHFIGLSAFPFTAAILNHPAHSAGIAPNTAKRPKHLAPHHASFQGLVSAYISISLLIPAVMCGQAIVDETRMAIIQERAQSYTALLDYVDSRKENIYIGAIYPDFRLFRSHDIDAESNYYFWGHFQSMMYSPLFYQKLMNAGINDAFDASIFFNDNVYYVGTDKALSDQLLAYINDRYDTNYEWEVVDRLPIIYVESDTGSRYVEESYDASRYAHPAVVEDAQIEVLHLRNVG